MLAAAPELAPPGAATVTAADLVVGVRPAREAGEAARTATLVARSLAERRPDRQTVVLLLSDDGAPPDLGLAAEQRTVVGWNLGAQGPLEATLRGALRYGARAAALVSGATGDALPGHAERLLGPVLDDGVDLAMPVYATQRFEGMVSTGIAAPLLRALFGRRLRQPLAEELALSRRLVDHLLGEAWLADPAHAGERSWAVTATLAGAFEVGEVHLGQRPSPSVVPGNLPEALAGVVGALFHQMRSLAPTWQRVRGSVPIRAWGEPAPRQAEEGQPQLGPLIEAFRLGHRELGRLWGQLLPPHTAVALKRLAAAPEEGFTLDDGLWARTVYDFAVGYHLATLDRAALLRSLTPLYLAWVASFVREVRELGREASDQRGDRLAEAFEGAKPYLIQRWRWPDRFTP